MLILKLIIIILHKNHKLLTNNFIVQKSTNQYFLLQDKVYQKRKNTIDLYIDGISLQKLLQDSEIEISIKLK